MKSKLIKILRWIQQYTKTDMVSLTKNGSWTMLSYVIQVGTGVITTIALANLLPKEILGTYQFILSVAAILSVLTLSGLSKAIISTVARGNDGVLRSGVRTKLKWNILIFLASGIVAGYYAWQGNNELAVAFLIVGAFAPLIEAFKLYHAFLIGKEAFRDTVMLGVWRKPLPLVAVVATAYLTNNITWMILAYFASHSISYVALYIITVRKYNLPKTEDEATISYSKHLSAINLFGKVASYMDKILIWHFLGAAAVASFTIAQLATKYSGGALNVLSQQVLPKVSKRDLPTLQKTLPHKVRLFTLVMAAGAGVYILLAPFMFALLFPEYPESIALSQVLALTLLFLPNQIYSQVLTAHRQIRSQYALSIIIPFIKTLLLFTLIPLYGIWGAVYVTLFMGIIGSITTRYFFSNAKSTN